MSASLLLTVEHFKPPPKKKKKTSYPAVEEALCNGATPFF